MRNAVRWTVGVAVIGLFVMACSKALSPTAPNDPKGEEGSAKDGKVAALVGPSDGGGAGPDDGGASGPDDCGVTGPNNHGGSCGGGGGGGTPGATPTPAGGGGGGGTGGLGNILPAPDPGVCPFRGLGSSLGLNLISGENAGAGDDFPAGESLCGVSGGQDVAISWQTSGPGCYRFDTNGSSFDTMIKLYEGCAGEEFFCDDDDGIGLQSQIHRNFFADQSMIIVIDGFSSGSLGVYTLSIDEVDSSFCTDRCGFGIFAQPVNVTGLNAPSAGYQFVQGSPSTGFGNGASIYSDNGTFTVSTGDPDLRDQPFIRTVRADGNTDTPAAYVSFDFESTCDVVVYVLLDTTAGLPPWVDGGYFATGALIIGGNTYEVYGTAVGPAGSIVLGPPGVGNEMYGIVVSTG
jgi:hypothetical protein